MNIHDSRDDITHVDFEAQKPLAPRPLPVGSTRFDIAARITGLVITMVIAILALRGCR
jgi:hypothetical protein